MKQYQTVICLFCASGKEKSVVEAIHRKGWGRAIFPMRLKPMRIQQQWRQTQAPLLPGYVFLYLERDEIRHDELAALPHILRVLRYDSGRFALRERDLAFADWVYRSDGKIGAMQALQIGDRIEIIDGAFKQLRGSIVRMDRRRRAFLVSLDNAGAIQKIWLTYEVIEKRDA